MFATLESVFGICVGCKAFAVLMRLGVIPESVCEECSDLSLRAGIRMDGERPSDDLDEKLDHLPTTTTPCW